MQRIFALSIFKMQRDNPTANVTRVHVRTPWDGLTLFGTVNYF